MFKDKESFKKAFLEKFEVMHCKSLSEGTLADTYKTLATMVKEKIVQDWINTNRDYSAHNEKQVYYFSMEVMPGKFLGYNLLSLGLRELVADGLEDLGIMLSELEAQEADAGLGNGGLGRLAACFLDSSSCMGYAIHGCCLRYKYGLFRQKIVDGYQVELPDHWLGEGNVWEIRKADKAVEVRFGGTVRTENLFGRLVFIHENYQTVMAVPYDLPVVGYGCGRVNTLRLFSAECTKDFDLTSFNRGDYLKAVEYKYAVEAISQILYPDDSSEQGKLLRLKQQYFLVSAGLQSIVRRYKRKSGSLKGFQDKIRIHINDTHPSLAIPELMRILIDEEGKGWEEAWEITHNTISYTNHTIMPEALEKWPVEMFKTLLPRIYMIVEEINARFCQNIMDKWPGDWQRVKEMAIIADGHIKMAHLAVVGCHRVNGVSRIHTEILKKEVLRNFYEYYPEKFYNITNGVNHRRFVLKANPHLASLLTDVLGPRWLEDPALLQELLKYKGDGAFLDRLAYVKKQNKQRLAQIIKENTGLAIDPQSIFDMHVKRIHAYKRQLLNILHIMDLYQRLRHDPGLDMVPRTFIFGGKAAPGYHLAKNTIKLINAVAEKINKDKAIRNKIKVIFWENYNVSQAELLIPAADVSQQISTASREASGTGNMKFMLNGAVTLGTLDGANIEIRDEVGEENMIVFGLTAEEVLEYYRHGGYNAWDEYRRNERLKAVIDQLSHGHAYGAESEFRDIYRFLLDNNDEFFILKDFEPYAQAQAKIDEKYRDSYGWLRMSLHNIACAGKFYSDRALEEYARLIWGLNKTN